MKKQNKQAISPQDEPKKFLYAFIIIASLVIFMTARYLLFGVPHEFLAGEYKGTFEGDYDFTIELVNSLKNWKGIPLWSQIYSGPIGVFVSNFHVIGQAFLYFFTHNLALSIKIYQVIYFIISGIGMFLLAEYIHKNWLAALFCSFLYMFTPFFIGEMLSYLHYTPTYFCLPLAYFFIFKAIDSEKYIFYSLSASIIIAFNLLSHPQNVFIGGIFYFLFTLVILSGRLFKMLFKRTDVSARIDLSKALKIFSIIGLLVALLSLFFVLPTLLNGYPYTRSLGAAGTWLNQVNKALDFHTQWHSQSLISALTLFHWPWFITPLKSMEYPPLIFMLIYSIPFALAVWGIFLGLRARNKNRLIILFVLGVVSFLFSLGVRAHSLDLFSLAYKYVPFFHMARAPYRYFYQAVLTICLFSGLFICSMKKRTAFILSALFIIPYLYAANYYGNNYNWTFIPSQEPEYFLKVQDWLKINNKSGHRVIETSGIPNALGLNQRMLPNGLDLLLRNIGKDYLDKFLALFGFKYILTPSLHCQRGLTFDKKGYMPPRADDGSAGHDNPEEYYSALTTEFLFVYDRLKADPGFKLYNADTKDVAIFENKSAFDNYRVYPAKGLMIVGGINAYDFLDLDRFQGYFQQAQAVKLAPIFIAQSGNLKQIARIKQASRELILHNTDFLDLVFLLNQDYLISLSKFCNKDWSFFSGSLGIQQPLPYHDHSLGSFVLGDLSFSDFSLVTNKKGASVEAPVTIRRQDDYRIMLRIFGGSDNSNVCAYLGEQYLGRIDSRNFSGFRWIQLSLTDLKPGDYTLKFIALEDKPICLDSICVIPDPVFQYQVETVTKDFADIPVTNIINKQNFIREGPVLKTDLYIAKDALYNIALRVFSASGEVREGKLSIDSKSMPVKYRLNKGFVNLDLGSIQISKGRHNIALDGLLAYAGIQFLSFSESKEPVEFNKPLILVHTETNYPGWKIKIGANISGPVITNMFLNGFIAPNQGKIGFNIFYQNFLQAIGRAISLIVFICILSFTIWQIFRLKNKK